MKLKIYLVENRMTVTEFASLIDYSRQYLSSVMAGKLTPSPKLIRLIEKATNRQVQAKDFDVSNNPIKKKGRGISHGPKRS